MLSLPDTKEIENTNGTNALHNDENDDDESDDDESHDD